MRTAPSPPTNRRLHRLRSGHRRAGVKTWPRLFQNLRASRETQLCERFPIHIVAEWPGNSPKTALAH